MLPDPATSVPSRSTVTARFGSYSAGTKFATLLASVVTGRAQTGVAEFLDFVLLQAVNRAEPLFEHLEKVSSLHPESLFQICLCLAGDLATFAHRDRRPTAFPAYRH